MSVQWKGDTAFYVYWDSAEKKQRWVKLLSRTEREAKQEADIIKGKRVESLRLTGSDPLRPWDAPWPEMVKKYLGIGAGNGNCDNTLARKKLHFKHIDSLMGIKMTSEWTIDALEEFKQRCRKEGAAPGVTNKDLGYIKAALRVARRHKFVALSSDDAREVRQVRNDAPDPEFFNDEDQAKILKVASPFWRVATLLSGLGGIRRSEALNLRWQDINFERKVMRMADRPDWRTKTRNSNTIPLHADLIPVLREWKAANPRETKVLPWAKDANEFSHAFKRLCKKAGIRGSYKSLRHGVGTGLMQQDVSTLKIRDILGHKSVKTTEKYAHVRARDLGPAIDKLASPLGVKPDRDSAAVGAERVAGGGPAELEGAIDALPSPLRLVDDSSNKPSNKRAYFGQSEATPTTANVDGGD